MSDIETELRKCIEENTEVVNISDGGSHTTMVAIKFSTDEDKEFVINELVGDLYKSVVKGYMSGYHD